MPEGIIGIKGNYIKHRLVCCNQRAGKSRREKQLQKAIAEVTVKIRKEKLSFRCF
jgi:hypothetical protein